MPRSHWLKEALRTDTDTAPRLEGDIKADVCIVGGGYTGLWTAIRLKEHNPSLDIVLIEADICGGGASGRNGGFVLSWWAKFSTLKKLCDSEEALRLAKASADAVREIGTFCDTHGIDAHYHYDGWLWAATSAAQIGAWDEVVADLDHYGVHPFVELSPEEVAQRSGSATHRAGIFEPTAAIVQPALLARGLRRVALEQGVRIFEYSPMTALERKTPPRVQTASGSVTAERVVLALNAWAARLPEFRRAFIVISSDIVATAPIPRQLDEIGWNNGLSISDSRLLVNYYRTTHDGRIAFGKGGGTLAFGGQIGTSFEGISPRAAEVTASLRSLYPSLADVPIHSSWTGPIDRTMSGMPVFGRLGGRPDILYGVGYSGNGVGPSYVGGRILASLALGLADEWASSGLVQVPLTRFPPEPFRFFGGLAVRAAIARKERAEDADRRPDALTQRLAELAPAGLVPIQNKEAEHTRRKDDASKTATSPQSAEEPPQRVAS